MPSTSVASSPRRTHAPRRLRATLSMYSRRRAPAGRGLATRRLLEEPLGAGARHRDPRWRCSGTRCTPIGKPRVALQPISPRDTAISASRRRCRLRAPGRRSPTNFLRLRVGEGRRGGWRRWAPGRPVSTTTSARVGYEASPASARNAPSYRIGTMQLRHVGRVARPRVRQVVRFIVRRLLQDCVDERRLGERCSPSKTRSARFVFGTSQRFGGGKTAARKAGSVPGPGS